MKKNKYVKLTESKFDDLQAGYDQQIDDIVNEKGQYIKYIDADGEKIPIPTGTKKPIYSKPVRFTASISSKLIEK